jgi:hypothetical protein
MLKSHRLSVRNLLQSVLMEAQCHQAKHVQNHLLKMDLRPKEVMVGMGEKVEMEEMKVMMKEEMVEAQ